MSSVDALRLVPPLADRRDGSRVSPSGRHRRRSRRSPSPAPMHRRRSPIPAPIHWRRSLIDLAPAHRHRRRSRTRSNTPIHQRRSSRSPPPAPIHRRCSSISPSPSAAPRRRSPSPRRRDDRHRWSPYHRPVRPSHSHRPPLIVDDEDLKGLIFTDYRFSKRQKLRMNLKSDFMWGITPSSLHGEPEEDDRKKPTRKSHVPDVSSSEAQSRSPPPKSRSRRKHTYSSEESDSSESESDSSPTPKRRKASRRRRCQRRESNSDESEESDDSDSSLKRRKHKSSKRSKNKVSPSPPLSPSPAIEIDVALIEAKKPEIMLRAWKEMQFYTAEDKRALAMFNYEEKAKVMADLQRLLQRHIGQDTGPAHDPFAPKPLDAADD